MPVGKGQANKRLLVGIVLDRSSSMGGTILETISGTNEQFSALRDSDDADNTFVAFNTFASNVTPVFKDASGAMVLVPAGDVKDITQNDYRPSGMTAMYDGVAAMIAFMAEEAKKVDDVMIVVISDGMENASKKTTSEKVASQVKELQDAGWNFTYIGANQDLTQVAAKLGFHAGNMMTYDANALGTANMNSTVASAVGTYAATRSVRMKSGGEGRMTTQSLFADDADADVKDFVVDVDADLQVVSETTTSDETGS